MSKSSRLHPPPARARALVVPRAAVAASFAALAGMAGPTPAFAQGAAPPSRPPALDPVVVTASRTAQPLLELLAE